MPNPSRGSSERLSASPTVRPPSSPAANKPIAGPLVPKPPLMRPAPSGSSQSLLQARSTSTKPTAPPVYRPQPIQRKQISHQQAASGLLFQPGTTPKVYRPETTRRDLPVALANNISRPKISANFPPIQLAARRGRRQPADPWNDWNDWAYIRAHFAAYGADQDSIAWLQVAQKERIKVPPRVGHRSRTGGKDYADQHVLGPLRTYIGELKEALRMNHIEVSERDAKKLSFWKRKHNIA